MNAFFIGLALSLAYGLLSSAVLLVVDGLAVAQAFLGAFTTAFRTLFSLGLILATALVVWRSQNAVPQTVEAAFTKEQLAKTDYHFYERRFTSVRRSTTFTATFIVVAFVIFTFCQFPLSGRGEALMVTAACAEYGLGVYVGRKLFYAGMMLQSLLAAPVTRNLFKRRELDDINSYVHVASTMTVIFVYVHVAGYYQGPFAFASILGESVKPFLILPAVIATPVLLIFNFYPRAVLRRLYSESIDVEIKQLGVVLKTESISDFEKRSYLMEVDRMSRDELRYSLQLTLSDLPIGIAVLVMVLEPLLS